MSIGLVGARRRAARPGHRQHESQAVHARRRRAAAGDARRRRDAHGHRRLRRHRSSVTVANEVARQLGDRYEIERLPAARSSALALLAVMLLRPRGSARRCRRRRIDEATAATRERRPSTPEQQHHPLRRWPRSAPAISSADGIVVRFGGFVALDGAGIHVASGRGRRADRPQRRRQDDAVQRDHRSRARAGRHRPRSAIATSATDPPHRIARAGLARTFQNLRLFPDARRCRENVELAALERRRATAPTSPPSTPTCCSPTAGLTRGRRSSGVDARLRQPATARAGPRRCARSRLPPVGRADVRDE